jgi:hypothetical protein
MIKMGPYTAAGVYETYVGSMAYSSLDLIISGTADVDVHANAGGTIWSAYAGMTAQTASVSGTFIYSVNKIRVTVNSISGGSSATVYISGLKDSK